MEGRGWPRSGWPAMWRDSILSLSMTQLVRHVMMLDRALSEAGTRLYVKVGTTGTGGMGLNIPYTHSEDRPRPSCSPRPRWPSPTPGCCS